MGKSKRRIINSVKNHKNDLNITRTEAIKIACTELETDTNSLKARDIITLFGLSAEELSEYGISYEVLKVLGKTVS